MTALMDVGAVAQAVRQIAREYLRVSRDRTGRMRSPEQQHGDIEQDAFRSGIELGRPYLEEKAVSASLFSNDERPGFEGLLADLRTNRFGADMLYLWESSRGSRRVSEWCELLDLLAERGVLVRVFTHGRTYDPRNPRDRRSLLEDAVDSEYETGKMSLRVRRDNAAAAAEGRPHGRPPYGIRSVHDVRTGKLLNWEPDPDTAPNIRDLFDRLVRGESLYSVEKVWEAAGILNGSGRPFSAAHLRDLAEKPAYTGLRAHKGEITEAQWEAIVPRAQWWEVQRILNERRDKSPKRPGKARHAFTTIIVCDVCCGPLEASFARLPTGEYKCKRKQCVRIPKQEIDEYLLGEIIAYLSRPDVYEKLTAATERTAEVERIEAELARDRAELDDAEATTPASMVEARMLAKLIEGLTERIADKESQLRTLTTPTALTALIEPGADVAERWDAAPVSAKRRAAAILLSPGYLGQVRIARAVTRNAPATDRIVWGGSVKDRCS